MATATLSSKNQITLPVVMVRNLGLKAGDKLDIELIDDRIVIWPKPMSYTDYFIGRLRGAWGNSVEEIDRYVAEERASWSVSDDLEDLEVLLSGRDPISAVARQIAGGLLARTPSRASYREIIAAMAPRDPRLPSNIGDQALNELIKSRAIRRVPDPSGDRYLDEYLLLHRAIPVVREMLASQ
jgi:AbrB family looped-hinge helix DNA binding protein